MASSGPGLPQCVLLNLPPELRYLIFELSLYMPTKSGMFDINSDIRCENGEQSHHTLALLQTCRQIHEEAEGLFYAINKFRVKSEWDKPLASPVAQMPSKALGSITEITVELKYQGVQSFRIAVRQFKHMRRLQSIHLIVPRSYMDL